MFEALGLSRIEEQVYLRLLRHGPASLASLAAATALTRRNLKGAIERLNAFGLVSSLRQERVMAVPLEIGVDHLIQQRRHDLEVIRQSALRLGSELQEGVRVAGSDQITVLTRPHDVSLALPHLCQAAEQELRILVRSGADGYPIPEVGQGVSRRVAFDLSLADLSVKGEAEVRLARDVPTDLALADRHSALLQLDQSALVVRRGNLFDALEALFEAVWARATPLVMDAHDAIDAQDRELLSLLVAGLTDDAAGARLNMSRRTVARRVQRLMMVTGAHSRLQLGWWARERDWLS
jgi:predicted transcriptional regulator